MHLLRNHLTLCQLTDSSVLNQADLVPSLTSRLGSSHQLDPGSLVKSAATFKCLFRLVGMRKWPSPFTCSSLSQFSHCLHRCEKCDRSFTQATQLSRHQRMPNECKPITESTESIEVD